MHSAKAHAVVKVRTAMPPSSQRLEIPVDPEDPNIAATVCRRIPEFLNPLPRSGGLAKLEAVRTDTGNLPMEPVTFRIPEFCFHAPQVDEAALRACGMSAA